ncbi:protein NDRG3-like, partial [Hyalella azteca]|uniref:Protein NDRG3-like n=1 Tax=Hyalella azteca TaxID=294128 RepID=A0A8B7P310_HYAAZ
NGSPLQVDALVLINCAVGTSGWLEWGYQKLNIHQLKAGTMTAGTVDYLMWHHFGKVDQCSQDVVTMYRQLFESHVNAGNLAQLIETYVARTDIGCVREMDPDKKKEARMVRCNVLNITSNYSPHVDDTVALNARLDPACCSWMKIQDCGLVLEEQPGKVIEALLLLLQGQGYAVHIRRLGGRQNSLPLVGDPPAVKGGSALPSVPDEGRGSPTNEETDASHVTEMGDDVTTTSSGAGASTNHDAAGGDDIVVGGASDTDIHITVH